MYIAHSPAYTFTMHFSYLHVIQCDDGCTHLTLIYQLLFYIKLLCCILFYIDIEEAAIVA